MIYFFCGSYIKLYFCHILLRSFPFCLKKKIVLFDLFCVKGIQSLITSYLSLESFCFYNIFFCDCFPQTKHVPQSPIPWHFVPCVVCLTVVISSAADLQVGGQGSQSESSVIPRINPAT